MKIFQERNAKGKILHLYEGQDESFVGCVASIALIPIVLGTLGTYVIMVLLKCSMDMKKRLAFILDKSADEVRQL